MSIPLSISPVSLPNEEITGDLDLEVDFFAGSGMTVVMEDSFELSETQFRYSLNGSDFETIPLDVPFLCGRTLIRVTRDAISGEGTIYFDETAWTFWANGTGPLFNSGAPIQITGAVAGVTINSPLVDFTPDEILATPNLGLWLPEDTDLGKDWPGVAAWNNNILTEFIGNQEWREYTPEIFGPNMGSGGNFNRWGRYQILPGNIVRGHFILEFGNSGVSNGSGLLTVLAPEDFDTEFVLISQIIGNASVVGQATLRDNSTGASSQLGNLSAATASPPRFMIDLQLGEQRQAGANEPFTWAADDAISGEFLYKAVI